MARPVGQRRDRIPTRALERPHWQAGRVVVGVDEVGRGAWAGPVTFAAVALDPARTPRGLRDSKDLRPADRERLASRIAERAVGVGIGHASNEEIDRLGMSPAMRLAAQRALAALPVRPDVLLVDGNWDVLAGAPAPRELVVGGDGRSVSIAAASIVAKVTRDAHMVQLDGAHPAYRFASNKGYPSPDHRAALDRVGPCAAHRHSWAPIARLAQPRLIDLP